jgi:hypothetical protein
MALAGCGKNPCRCSRSWPGSLMLWSPRWSWLVRGTPDPELAMLTSLSPEDLIPVDPPTLRIRKVVDAALGEPLRSSPRCTRRRVGREWRRSRAEGDGVDGDVLDPRAAGVLRATQLGPRVQVVLGPSDRRQSVRRGDVFKGTLKGRWITRSRIGSSLRSSVKRSCVATYRVLNSPSMGLLEVGVAQEFPTQRTARSPPGEAPR